MGQGDPVARASEVDRGRLGFPRGLLRAGEAVLPRALEEAALRPPWTHTCMVLQCLRSRARHRSRGQVQGVQAAAGDADAADPGDRCEAPPRPQGSPGGAGQGRRASFRRRAGPPRAALPAQVIPDFVKARAAPAAALAGEQSGLAGGLASPNAPAQPADAMAMECDSESSRARLLSWRQPAFGAIAHCVGSHRRCRGPQGGGQAWPAAQGPAAAHGHCPPARVHAQEGYHREAGQGRRGHQRLEVSAGGARACQASPPGLRGRAGRGTSDAGRSRRAWRSPVPHHRGASHSGVCQGRRRVDAGAAGHGQRFRGGQAAARAGVQGVRGRPYRGRGGHAQRALPLAGGGPRRGQRIRRPERGRAAPQEGPRRRRGRRGTLRQPSAHFLLHLCLSKCVA
mmetsp:Transcript_28541/g.90288  ORF Transcript_28541/g.90288 Transcript_28541/m.90288 type:complete len:397 (+) Transcript_28541:170-1360(+)